MLSTAQALQEWDKVLKLLNEARTHAAAHPNQLTPPEGLKVRLKSSVFVLQKKLASPVTTWKQLLKLKVPYLVLGACSDLMATYTFEPTLPVRSLAALLFAHADETLPPVNASTTHPSSSSSTNTSSGLSAMHLLWEQVEQSGLLQALPDQLSCTLQELHGRMPSQASGNADRLLSRHPLSLLFLLESLLRLYPSLLTVHPAGQQCVVPAMQLCFSSLQHISTALAQGGRQEWMPGCVDVVVRVLGYPADAWKTLLKSLPSQRPTGHSTTTSSSGSSQREVALAMLKAEQTTQWACLGLVVPMLAHHLQQVNRADTSTGNASTSTSSTPSQRSAATSVPPTGSAGPPSLSGSGDQWLPVALAPTMPAAYSSMLEPLGCSREVGLWLAARMSCAAVDVSERGVTGLSPQQRAAWARSAHCLVLGGLEVYHLQQRALMTHRVVQPQTAALHLSVSAMGLQWLSDLPPDTLLRWPESCNRVCHKAWDAYKFGQMLLELQGLQGVQELQGLQGDLLAELTEHGMLEQPAAGAAERAMSANQLVAQLGASVADKMLGLHRGLTDDAAPSTVSSSSGGASRGNDGSGGRMLLQSCQHVSTPMAAAIGTAADLEDSPAATQLLQEGPREVPQLPVQSAQCCKLLQDCVRLAAAAPLSNVDPHTTNTMLECVASLLGAVEAVSNTAATHTIGPLVAAPAMDVSSPDALQLFGLLCSLLKVEHRAGSSTSSSMAAAWVLRGIGGDKEDVSTSVLAAAGAVTAVTSVLRGAMDVHVDNDSSQGGTCAGGSGSSNNLSSSSGSSSSGSTAHSSKVAAALPWLVLLGRCCCACAVLVQRWQGSMLFTKGPTFQSLKILAGTLESVVRWLAAAGTQHELCAMGYKPHDLQQQLAETAQALRSLTSEPLAAAAGVSDTEGGNHVAAGTAGPAGVQAVEGQLQAAGRALACFAIPHACNNPACRNVCGPSEARLVGGRSCVCAGCRTARYCGRVCQRAAWQQHKLVCKALAAAATAATQAAVGEVAESTTA